MKHKCVWPGLCAGLHLARGLRTRGDMRRLFGLVLLALPALLPPALGAGVFSSRALYFDVATGVTNLLVSDLDGDGRPDFIAPNGTATFGVAILWGLGDGTYSAKLSLTTMANPRGVAVGDLNGDGR